MATETEKRKKLLYIDNRECFFDSDKPIIRIAEENGIFIPRFCEHPELDPVALCRQCLVEIEGEKKLATSCSTYPREGMKIHTQYSSIKAKEGQELMLELLLINHPLDCPMCDKGGECPLQNQAFKNGQPKSHFDSKDKRLFKKPIALSDTILLDRERCVNCARCTRFSSDIAGDAQIVLSKRGYQQQVSIAKGKEFISYFSGNTVQICPVGALTTTHYRFQSRPFDLVSTKTTCEHCAVGCSLRVDVRNNKITRCLAYKDPLVNGEWACNKGFLIYENINTAKEFFRRPLMRRNGILEQTTYTSAIETAANMLSAGKTALLVGGRLPEATYRSCKKLAKTLNTKLVDFRIRQYKKEESLFLKSYREDILLKDKVVSYNDLSKYSTVVLAAANTEEEAPVLFLKLKTLKKQKKETTRVVYIGEYLPRSSEKIPLDDYMINSDIASSLVTECSGKEKTLVIVGESVSFIDGLPTALCKLIKNKQADVMWMPRRSGEISALNHELLSYNYSLQDILELISSGQVENLISVGLDIEDLRCDENKLLKNIRSIISFDCAKSKLIESKADIAIPVASNMEQDGYLVNLEGRKRQLTNVFYRSNALSSKLMKRPTADSLINRLVDKVKLQDREHEYRLNRAHDRSVNSIVTDGTIASFNAVTFIPFWNMGAAQRESKQLHKDYYTVDRTNETINVFLSKQDMVRYNLMKDNRYLLAYNADDGNLVEFPVILSVGKVVDSKLLIPLYHKLKIKYGDCVLLKKLAI